MSEQKNNVKKIRKGIVVSDKPDKTVVVRVNRVKVHPVYKKRIVVSKKFHVHDPENKYKVGDMVQFVESRPFSKKKKWIIVN